MSSTTIDDQDLTHVTYTGTWVKGGSIHEHDETVSSSTNEGDYFTVKFYGNSLTVYGTIDSTSGGVLTNYSVDSASSQQVASQTGAGDTYNQQFWKSPILAVGEHNLKVTMAKINNNSGSSEGTIWFDYFLVEDPTIRSDPGPHRKHTGAIVGGVLGGMFTCILIALACVFFQRRQRKKGEAVQIQPVFWPKNNLSTNTPRLFNIGPLPTEQIVVEPFPPDPSQDQDPSATPHDRRNATQNINVLPRSLFLASVPQAPHDAVGKRQVNNVFHERHVSDSYNHSHMRSWQHTDSSVQEVNLDRDANLELPPVYSPV